MGSTQSDSFSAPITSTVPRGAGADHVRCGAQPVTEAGAGGVDVEGWGRPHPDPVCGLRGGVRYVGGHRAGCDQDRVDIAGAQPGVGERLGSRIDCHVDD